MPYYYGAKVHRVVLKEGKAELFCISLAAT
jgi:hypothetical protein